MNSNREERRRNRMIRLEASLYAAGRPVNIEDLKYLVGTRSDNVMKRLVNALSRRYKKRGGALEIKSMPGNRVVLQLNQDHNDLVKEITSRPLLTMGPLKTLSYVAYHQPVKQTMVVEDRGTHVYAHLRRMEDMGLIIREPTENGSYIIQTTPYFSDYFGFSQDPAKSKLQLQRIFNQLKITKLDNGDDSYQISKREEDNDIDPLTDPRNGFSHRFTDYPRASNQGS